LTEGLLRRVRNLVRRHPLRGADAVPLAAALELRSSLGTQVTFVAADRPLLAAARRERLLVLDPEG